MERIEGSAVDELVKRKKDDAKFSGDPVQPGSAQEKDQTSIENFFEPGRFFARGVAAVVEEMMVKVDADRAGLGARAAE